jgi:L-fuconolactonase
MPSFPIVDTHLHIWDLSRLRYPWLANVPMLNKNHLIGDYRSGLRASAVAKMVFLQCECAPAQFQAEADWVTEVAQADPRIRGIVPWAPLEKGEGARAELARLAANPLIKGIRRIIQFEADPAFCLRPDFVRGVQLLPEYGLSFDLCINHTQLANTIKLVRQCSEREVRPRSHRQARHQVRPPRSVAHRAARTRRAAQRVMQVVRPRDRGGPRRLDACACSRISTTSSRASAGTA